MAKQTFVKRFQDLHREAMLFIAEFVRKNDKVDFGTPEELENEDYIQDSLPHTPMYDKNGCTTDDFAVAGIYKTIDGYILIRLIGFSETTGQDCNIPISDIPQEDCIYLAQALSEREPSKK